MMDSFSRIFGKTLFVLSIISFLIFPSGHVTAQNKFKDASSDRLPNGVRHKKNLSSDQKRMIEQLEAIGYLSGAMKKYSGEKVTIHKKNSCYEGYNLIVSGHGPEAVLVDMDGREVYKWHCSIYQVWPEFTAKGKFYNYWRRAYLQDNGDILVIFEGVGLAKLDKNSNILWKVRNRAHHDLHITEDGSIYVLTREARIRPDINEQEPVLEDFVSVLDHNGHETHRYSVLDILLQNKDIPALKKLKTSGDILHTNAVKRVENQKTDVSHPFQQGMLLLSVREIDLVCAINIKTGRIEWFESGIWKRQHDPHLLDNGNLLVFDNESVYGRSRVIELNPVYKTITWIYEGSDSHPFFTPSCGTCQRLPNGNTLITESESGRVFEVTPGKEIVWEYLNPNRAGANSNLVATLFDTVRIKKEAVRSWLK